MNSKVLIFSCASKEVLEKVVNKLEEKSDITFLVQNTYVDWIRETYSYANLVSLGTDYFSYQAFCENVEELEPFDIVIIPSSSENFHGFDEVFKIADIIRCKKRILFNRNEEEIVERISWFENCKEWLYGIVVKFCIKIISMWYKCIGKKKKI